MLALNTACLILATPTFCKSISVSTEVSYKFNTSLGGKSRDSKFSKFTISENASFLKIILIVSTTVFNTGKRSTNILCKGR